MQNQNIQVVFHNDFRTCDVPGEVFNRIKTTFDVYASPSVKSECILDATAFDDQGEDCFKYLVTIIGYDAACDCAGGYVLFCAV